MAMPFMRSGGPTMASCLPGSAIGVAWRHPRPRSIWRLRRNPAESLNPAWKTGNYLNNILCLREAKTRGADEVVILNLAGEVTEAAVCNLAFVRGGEFITPPLQAGILGGITRSLLLEEI